MHQYFCNECGHSFEHPLPERSASGLLNDIPCPRCGGWNVYPDTPDGRDASVKETLEHEAVAAEWEDADDLT